MNPNKPRNLEQQPRLSREQIKQIGHVAVEGENWDTGISDGFFDSTNFQDTQNPRRPQAHSPRRPQAHSETAPRPDFRREAPAQSREERYLNSQQQLISETLDALSEPMSYDGPDIIGDDTYNRAKAGDEQARAEMEARREWARELLELQQQANFTREEVLAERKVTLVRKARAERAKRKLYQKIARNIKIGAAVAAGVAIAFFSFPKLVGSGAEPKNFPIQESPAFQVEDVSRSNVPLSESAPEISLEDAVDFDVRSEDSSDPELQVEDIDTSSEVFNIPEPAENPETGVAEEIINFDLKNYKSPNISEYDFETIEAPDAPEVLEADPVEVSEVPEVPNTSEAAEAQPVEAPTAQESDPVSDETYDWDGPVLNSVIGTIQGPSGKETYYNLNMSGVIDIMRGIGNNDEYWVRDDGVKMLGDYVMVAADLDIHPRGSHVPTSLGMGVVCDTGDFIYDNPQQLDIAVSW